VNKRKQEKGKENPHGRALYPVKGGTVSPEGRWAVFILDGESVNTAPQESQGRWYERARTGEVMWRLRGN